MSLKLGKNPYYNPEEVIAVGDIHADINKLQTLIQKLLPLNPHTHLVFTGDLIDRGEDLFLVLDFLKNLKSQYPQQVYFLEGNHDHSLKTYLEGDASDWMYKVNTDRWLQHGGEITKSQLEAKYGQNRGDIKQGLICDGYWDIFESMLMYYETPDHFITHAPIDPFMGLLYLNKIDEELEDNEQAKALMEGFAEYLEHKVYSTFTEELPFVVPEWPKLVENKTFVSGHQTNYQSEPRIKGNRIFLDVQGDKLFAYSSKTGIISS